jgi:PAS domain S-box-containing protein
VEHLPPGPEADERTRELFQSELKFRTMVETAHDWERWDAPDGSIIYSSPSCERITGYPPPAFEGDAGMLERLLHPDDLPRWKAHYARVHQDPSRVDAAQDASAERDLRILRADGTTRWIDHTCTPLFDASGRYQGRRVRIRDITERKAREQEREHLALLDRLNRTRKAILECNQVVVRASGEQELLREFCRLSMQVEGVHQAWVGLAERDPACTIRPAACLGFKDPDWTQARLSWADDAFGQGPAGVAIRTGQVCIQPLALSAPGSLGRCEEDHGPASGSAIALPLLSDQQAFGALVLHSMKADTFEEEPVEWLLELANNLAIGILDLRTRAERDVALQTAERQTEQLRTLVLELAQTEQRERRHLAQLLHDHLQQLLVGATFNIGLLDGQPLTMSGRKTLMDLRETIQKAIQVSRALTIELNPPVVGDKRLAGCLEWLGRHFHKHHGLKVALALEGDVEAGPEPIRLFIFEAVRELLLNVVKHAEVNQAQITLAVPAPDRVEITVEDQGVGFDPARLEQEAFPAEGLGLFSLRERLRFLKGSLEIVSSPGHGSRFTLVVPAGPREGPPAGAGATPSRTE